ncbi:hypothetical protein PIB30_066250 [Stylosanthes scabra]|uniref:Uncharacterized protein n=1 Tax=Stylosanthes scabra TaxID=79078 RepID=A0ABU6YJT0_9FABA|nr:hypothetical protein [Stylosanthes scabra]
MEESPSSTSGKGKKTINHERRKKVRTEQLNNIEHTTTTPVTGLSASSPRFLSPSQTQISLNAKNKRKVGQIFHSPLQEITNIAANQELNDTTSAVEESYTIFTSPNKENLFHGQSQSQYPSMNDISEVTNQDKQDYPEYAKSGTTSPEKENIFHGQSNSNYSSINDISDITNQDKELSPEYAKSGA